MQDLVNQRSLKQDISNLSITEASALITSNPQFAIELWEAQMKKIKKYNETYRVFISIFSDSSACKPTSQTKSENPNSRRLHGITFAIKDNIFVQGKKTT